MSAPTLSAKEQQASLRSSLPKSGKEKAKKHTTIKNVLFSPHNTSWPDLENEKEAMVLDKLKEFLQKFALPKENGGKQKKNSVKNEVKEMKQNLRSLVVFGVNSVTKELEKDKLDLVVTCRSAKPAILIQHLIDLSATRNCVAICIHGLSNLISDKIKIGCIAIGFKKTTEDSKVQDFKEFITYVRTVVPQLSIAISDIRKPDINTYIVEPSQETIEGNEIDNIDPEKRVDNVEIENKKCSFKSSLPKSSVDFSRFYVLKTDPENVSSSSFGDFIPLVSDGSSEDEHQTRKTHKRTLSCSEIDDHVSRYVSVDVREMRGNKKKSTTKKRKR